MILSAVLIASGIGLCVDAGYALHSGKLNVGGPVFARIMEPWLFFWFNWVFAVFLGAFVMRAAVAPLM